LIAPGYYLVEWTKPGYVFEELGGLALAKDTTLSDRTLIPGEIQYVSGGVSGIWTRNFVYIVTSDINIPNTATLIIKPGVRVKFSKNTGLTSYGRLVAVGTPTQRIKFTSAETSPQPGDWKSIAINSMTYDSLINIDYDYASTGISGYNLNYSIFDNIKMWGTLGNSSSGGLYFTNSNYLTIKNCEILTKGSYGISIDGVGCTITNNKISGAFTTAGISTIGESGTRVDSNVVIGKPSTGILISQPTTRDTTYIRFNTLDVATNGIMTEGSKFNISNNVISGFASSGINGGYSSIIAGNRLISDYLTINSKVGISGHGKIINNYIVLKSNNQDNYQTGIRADNSMIENDTIIIENAGGYLSYGIYSLGQNGRINNNFVRLNVISNRQANDSEASFAIKSNGQLPSTYIPIQGNTIELENQAHGIMSGVAAVSNNRITGIGMPKKL
jgi:hypothetical protein